MRFSNKIFASSLLIAGLSGLGITFACREYAKNQTKAGYLSKYSVLSESLGNALSQLEAKSENLLYGAGRTVALEDDRYGLLTTDQLKALRDDLGITHLFVVDADGKFIRSTNEDPHLIPNLFSFCPDYRRLVSGELRSLGTPIIPPMPEPKPFKFITVANSARTRLIEAGLRVDFIGGMLSKAIEQDANMVGLNLYAPDGTSLGKFGRNQFGVAPGKTALPPNLPTQLEDSEGYRLYAKVGSSQPHCCQCEIAGISRGGEYYYVLESIVSKRELNATLASIERYFWILGASALLLALLTSRIIARTLTRRLERVIVGIRQARKNKSLGTALVCDGNDEIALLASEFNGLQSDLGEAHAAIVNSKREAAMGEVARQVSHDIRTPLAALDSIFEGLAQLPEEQRLIVRSAVGRIRDIANQLLGSYCATSTDPAPSGVECLLLSSIIDAIVTEERLQFRSRLGIEIEARLDSASYGLFARIQATEFKRALSNLINNSVEAIGERGVVVVSLIAAENQVHLRVQDNGKGIPRELLSRLGQLGTTHGKTGGSGLGLYHARTSIESWGGSLELESEVGKGTTVTIKLPRAEPPAWFVSKLEFPAGGRVIVVDDDTSIHRVWQGRISSLKAAEHGIEVLHFSTPEELRSWVRENAALVEMSHFLLDFELVGSGSTGLGLAEELKIGHRSILVTSHYDEGRLVAECVRLKMRMIPKGLAGFVPIGILPSEAAQAGLQQKGPDAVLLDDDHLALAVWRLAAKKKGLVLAEYRRRDELLAGLVNISKETPIYLDCELGDGVRGDAVACDLHARGYVNLFLATGHPPDLVCAYPWLRVVGKNPPWG